MRRPHVIARVGLAIRVRAPDRGARPRRLVEFAREHVTRGAVHDDRAVKVPEPGADDPLDQVFEDLDRVGGCLVDLYLVERLPAQLLDLALVVCAAESPRAPAPPPAPL